MTAHVPTPYVGPPYHWSTGNNLPIHRIVLHGTVSPCVPGNARAVARYFATSGSGGSAHYIADPKEIVQDAHDDLICWHAPPNQYSLGIEMSDMEAGDPKRWFDAAHTSMLKLVALLVVDLSHIHHVPLVKLSVADLLAGKHGLCGHVDVSNAWHQSDHHDPTDFPWDHFMTMIHDAQQSINPPQKHPLADAWLHASGDVIRALEQEQKAAQEYVNAHPGQPAFQTLLNELPGQRDAASKRWHAVKPVAD